MTTHHEKHGNYPSERGGQVWLEDETPVGRCCHCATKPAPCWFCVANAEVEDAEEGCE